MSKLSKNYIFYRERDGNKFMFIKGFGCEERFLVNKLIDIYVMIINYKIKSQKKLIA